jgi:hypothetical protein
VDGVAGRDGVPKPGIVFSRAELAAMPQVKVAVKGDRVYEGVLLSEVLRKAGQPFGEELRGSLLSRFVIAEAKDGYRVLFSLPELDPVFRENQTIVALRLNGKDLPAREGPLRIVAANDKREARWMRMLQRIDLVSSPEPVR